MLAFRWSGVMLLAAVAFLGTACGDNGDGDGTDAGPSCTSTCSTLGETRCQGAVIEGCAIAPDGCLKWTLGVDCASSSQICNDASGAALCELPSGTCTDGLLNQDETDLDCGGTLCGACGEGLTCRRNADCDTGVCDVGRTNACITPVGDCADLTQNGTETDIDCGGTTCPACGDGRDCIGNTDCQSGYCDVAGTQTCGVAPVSCNDGIRNQDETDIDCGGTVCGGCTLTRDCGINSDCLSGICDPVSQICAPPPNCADAIRNQDETDVDCGGSVCGPCAEGDTCQSGSDCQSTFCDAVSGVCVPPGSCTDGLVNQDETGIDCGGSTCGACPEGETCLGNADCQSSTCDLGQSNACVSPTTPTCADGVTNQDETAVDCGGSCPACALGQSCQSHADCQSGVCDLLDTRTCINTDPMFEVNEDYETGDFSLFPYAFADTAGHPWIIETDPANCHGGNSCARTDPAHAQSEISSYEVSLSVRQDTTIAFWAKVNSEPGEHFFRFYIDGVEQVAVSGQVDWTLYSFPVLATGPNGPDRLFTWEFNRNNFMDPNHPPWIEAWVDDIDMPDWNTPPSIPEVIRPWNGKLTTDDTPVFEWQSFDPDFDTITYQMEYDTDPAFSLPQTTGETNNNQFTPPTPLADGTIYYWRVRAKDDSDFRWSAWGGPWSVQIDTAYEYASVWRQSVDAEFAMDTLSGGVTVTGDQVVTTTASYSDTRNVTPPALSVTRYIAFTGVPLAPPGTSGIIYVWVRADINTASSEYFDVYLEGTLLGRLTSATCIASNNFTISDISPYTQDGTLDIELRAGAGVDVGGCTAGTPEAAIVTASFDGVSTGSIVSTPIDFSLFEGKATWEKVQLEGSGNISLRVLDASGTPLPDTILPGNTAGLSRRTVHLWNVEPRDYPVLLLEATLGATASLDAWQVVGNDVYSFTFSHDGDDEGWSGADLGVTPTWSTAADVFRLDSLAAGTDPHALYVFDQPLDATRFTTVEVRLRSGNNYNNDTVTFYWESNYGLFDARRSFTHPDVFLLNLQDITYDLTTVPQAPKEPWQGQIEAIRIDPVDRFFDNLVQPADGWFEIDRIAIY